MEINLTLEVARELEAWTHFTPLEFSGIGFVKKFSKKLQVYRVEVLNIGSFGFTRIDPMLLLDFAGDPDAKCWFHRHPVGDGKPGWR